MLLLTINHQSLIATKTRRIVNQAKNCPVMEFGARRAHGVDAALYGARAAIIGGAIRNLLHLSAKILMYLQVGQWLTAGFKVLIQNMMHLKTYAEIYPNNCTFLIDTYNTLESGLPNAIKVFDKILKPKGIRPIAVKIR